MRHLVCVLLAACFASFPNALRSQTLAPAEQEVVGAIRARMDAAAQRQVETWARYVADGCILSSDDGSLMTKAQMLAHYKKVRAEYDRALDPRDFKVHIYGDTAVANYRATTHEQFGATDITNEQRRTDTLIKRNGAWLLIAIQWNNLPVNYREPTSGSGGRSNEYVGQYRARPEDEIETISFRDGKLWSQTGEEGAWCLPAGGETFFYREDLGSFTFTRNAQGVVTGYTYRRSDGREIFNQKIK